MNVLDLFSGIGGFSLGLEATGGFRTIAFCEIEPYAQSVLRKHWPDIPIATDITKFDGYEWRGRTDVICGGFPCQDISTAGKGEGITGKRSGLWSEYARIIGEIRPRYVIVENVAMLLSRGLERVLGDLASIGYDAEWYRISAADAGARHLRKRIWIVAYPRCLGGPGRGEVRDLGSPKIDSQSEEEKWEWVRDATHDSCSIMANAKSERRGEKRKFRRDQSPEWIAGSSKTISNPDMPRLQGRLSRILQERACERSAWQGSSSMANTQGSISERQRTKPSWEQSGLADPSWWEFEPAVGRVANGVPSRVDRLKYLGNAIVPQIAQAIGEAIMNYEAAA